VLRKTESTLDEALEKRTKLEVLHHQSIDEWYPLYLTSSYNMSLCLGVQVQKKLAAQKHEEELADAKSELHQTRSALTEAYQKSTDLGRRWTQAAEDMAPPPIPSDTPTLRWVAARAERHRDRVNQPAGPERQGPVDTEDGLVRSPTRSRIDNSWLSGNNLGAAPLRTSSQDRSSSRPEQAPTGGLRDKARGAYLERYVSSPSPAEQVLAAEKTGVGSWRLS
jgi:hypothetical protein